MRKKIIAFVLALGITLSLSSIALAVDPATDPFGLDSTAKSAGIPGSAASTKMGPAQLAGTIIGYVLAFVGVIFFGIMLYGGFLWMTARGASEPVKKAKDMLIEATIGIVIVFLSYVVTNFVLRTLLSTVGG